MNPNSNPKAEGGPVVDTGSIRKLDSAHHLHPFMVHHELRAKGPRVITHGDGVYVWDSEGNKIFDGMSGLWCVQMGYGVQPLIDAAQEALQTLPFYNTFFQTTTPYAAELASAVASKTPENLDQIFFAGSGSEANDTAIKMVWYYWNLRGKPNKKAIISRHRSYHGSTIAAASMSGLSHMHGIFDLPLPRFHHIEPTPSYFEYGQPGETEEAFAARAAQALEDKILELGPDNVGAFVGEPVMGAGGLMIPPGGYWQKIEAICRKYDILLWSDEVICGFGRTGSWFGCQTYGYNPDIITMAKGLSNGYIPISAVAVHNDIAETLINSDKEMAHGYTYSGHPVACAVALKMIELLETTGVIGDVGAENAAYFQKRFAELEAHPLVIQARGVGFLGALELGIDAKGPTRYEPSGTAGGKCRDHCFDNGIIMRAVNDTMILAPPLIITPGDIDEMITRITRALDATARDLMS